MRWDFLYIHDQKLKFQWPYVDDFHDVENLEQNVLANVLKYELNRRGGFLIDLCIKEVFENEAKQSDIKCEQKLKLCI